MAVRIQLRRDTADNWASENPVLRAGEVGIETDTLKFKIGNGTSTWSQITSYANVTPSSLTSSLSDYILAADQGTPGGPAELNSSGELIIPENSIVLWNDADYDYITTLTATQPTADRTITIPNATGTVALAENVAALSGATFTGAVSGTSLTLSGDLTVNGSTTNINSTNLVIEDKNIVLGDTDTPTDTTADGGGITLKGTTDKTFNWVDSTDSWTSSEDINLLSGKTYDINGSTVLSSTQVLGKSVPDGTIVGTSDTQSLTNKTLTNPVVSGLQLSDSSIVFEGSSEDSNETTLTVANPTADRTITFPDVTGTVVTTGDAATVTNTMLSGSIANDKLTNSAITINGTSTSLGGSRTLGTDDVSEGSTNKYFTDERAQDAVAAALAAGTHTNITVGYNDNGNAISLTGAVTYTDEDAQDAIGNAVGTGLSYNDTTGAISVDTTTIQARVADVSDTEIGYLNGVTSAIQTQINTLNTKNTVKVASVSNFDASYSDGVLTFTSPSALVVGSYTASAGDRILVKDQTDKTQNGVYTVTTAGESGSYTADSSTGPTSVISLPANNYLAMMSSPFSSLYVGQQVDPNKTYKLALLGSGPYSQVYTVSQLIDLGHLGQPTIYSCPLGGTSNGSGLCITSSINTVLTRIVDFDTTPELAGSIFRSTYDGKAYVCRSNDTSSISSTNIIFNEILDTVTAAATYQTIVSDVSNTEIGYLNGVTSAIQTQLNDKAPINNPTFTGTVTLAGDPSSSLHAATKQYVDNTASGIVAKPQVLGATTANIDATYNNGTAGVGATLTHNTNGVLPSSSGGATGWAVGKGILVKNQTNKAQNGRYFVSDMGSVSTPYVLTRCSFCDEASEIPGAYIYVQAGTSAGTGWIQVVADPATFVVGTDNIDVYQFSGSGTYTAGTGLTLTGNEYSINTSVTADLSTAQTLTNKTLTSPKINEDVALTATATELNVLDGITSTTAELNILDGVTSTAAELNLLDGVTATTTELNYVDGVTSGIQTQLDGKVDESLFDTKGDILVASADNTPAKLAAGTNGYLLTANSAATNGIEWAAAPISLPSQTNNSGKYLITDGSSASWSTLPINIITQVTIDSSSSSAVLDTLPALSFVSAEYIVSITQYDNSTEDTKVRTSRVLIQTDGVSVDLTEYGIVETNGLISGVAISADVTQDILTLTDNVRLLANISDATVNVARARIVRTLVTPWVDTVPDAPISVSGTSGNGQSVVSFTAPVDNGGDPVDDYTVTASPGGATATGASSPITVTGLTNGTSYTFTVVATNGVGSSQASQASSSVTPSTVPDSPTIDSATAGNTEIAVAFSAPASNGGAAITGYTAKATPAVGSTITATGTSSPITITGLTNGTAYNVALFATNIKGNSTDATHGSSVTPILPITLTGGTITNAGGYRYHTFTSTDNLILSNGNKTVDILCIAGGGGGANGGGAVNGGGGGAGGLQLFSNQTLTPGTYLATVGSGGTGGAQSFQRGSNGTNSQFGSLTASVGGGGGGRDSYTGGGAQSAQNGIAGGSGGGGGGYYTNSSGGAGTSGQGFAGGSGVSGGAAGGGGGSAAVGSRPDAGAGSDYSAWATATTTGSSGFYAGGGGGGVTSGTAGQGAAGGGVGGSGSSAGVNATANTGSGGGGGSRNGSNSGSGNGSNGLVIVRYVA